MNLLSKEIKIAAILYVMRALESSSVNSYVWEKYQKIWKMYYQINKGADSYVGFCCCVEREQLK